MAFIQKNRIPPPEIEYFNLSDFSGGLNNVDSYTELRPNESSDLLNLDFFSEVGVVQKRQGCKKYDDTILGDAVTYIGEYRPYEGAFQLVRATNSEVYVGTTKIADVEGMIDAVNYMGGFYFVDGKKIRIYSKFPQTEDTHTKIIGTAVDEYRTFELITPPTFTPIDDSHKQGIWKYNYDNNTCWYEACKQELDDEFKGTNVLPSEPYIIEVNDKRLYISSSNKEEKHNVYITDIENGFYFPVVLGLGLEPNGDTITALKVFQDAIIVGRKNDVHAIYGDTNITTLSSLYKIKKLNTHTGMTNNRTACVARNHLLYLGNDGNYYGLITPRTDTEMIMTTKINQTVDLMKKPLERDNTSIENNFAVFYRDLYFSTVGDRTMIYSYNTRSWTIFGGLDVQSMFIWENELLLGLADGRTLVYGYDYNDDGQAITCYFTSKRFDMNYPSRIKKFKDMYVIAHTYDGYNSKIHIKFEVDYDDIDADFPVLSQLSRWGVVKWGDILIARNILKSLPIRINRRGRLIRFIFSNDALNEAMKVYEVNGQFELKGFR